MDTTNHTDAAVRLAAIIDSSSDAIIGQTLEGIVTEWNPAAELLYGYTASEAVNQPISIIIPTEKQKEFDDTLKKIRKGEKVSAYETICKHKNGKSIHVLITISPIKTFTGNIMGACSITRDISDLRLMERKAYGESTAGHLGRSSYPIFCISCNKLRYGGATGWSPL